ncbi:MAG: patatin-like phospholipase family protein [Spirochaetaceae bacterium]|nr:patatin-like phospholipase family protein [Spirochaetaceae bacterium]
MKKNAFLILCMLCTALLFSQEHDRPVVALVLAGGGAMGLSHVGVLQVLEEEGIHPDIVLGSSMGSVVGGFYCAGYTPWEMEDIFYNINWVDILSDSYKRSELSFEQKMRQAQYALTLENSDNKYLGNTGLSHGQNVVEFLDEHLLSYSSEMDFDDLPIPFRAIGADLLTGEKIVYSRGDLKTVIRASMAIPGLFTPVKYQGRYIIDGDWVDNLPTGVARDLGADIVIAVSLYSLKENPEDLASLESINYQAFQIRNIERQRESIEAADLVISPKLSDFDFLNFDNGGLLIQEGYNAASEMREEIAALAEYIGKTTEEPIQRISREPKYTIARVIINGGIDFIQEEKLYGDLIESIGANPSISILKDFLYRYYDSGDYSHFWYQLIPDSPGFYTLNIDAPKRPVPTESLSLGLEYSTHFLSNNVSNIEAQIAFRKWFENNPNFSLGLDLNLSQFPGIQLDSDYYFFNRNMIFSAEGHWEQNPRLFYENSTLRSVYAHTAYGGSIALGIPLYKMMEFSTGIYGESHGLDHRQGMDFLTDSTWLRCGVKATGLIDTLDRVITPTRGFHGLFLMDGSLDHQQLPLLQGVTTGEFFIPFKGDRFIFSSRWETQHLLYGSPHPLELRSIGDSLGFFGYYDQELSGNNGAYIGGEIRFKVANLPLGAGDEIYLRLAGNSASLWDNVDFNVQQEYQFYSGISLGVLANLILGELSLDLLYNDQNRFSLRLGLTTSSSLLK